MQTRIHLLIVSMFLGLMTLSVSAQTTEFTYQGSLKDGAIAANGNYDFEFLLFDSLTGGLQQGATLTRSTVAVSNGTFSVKLDFGGQFPGANRFVEIHVRAAGGGAFTPLTPRQSVGSSPYAVQSLNAANATSATTATNATQLGGVAANQFVQTGDARLSDARTPTAGSTNYIQNTTSTQAASDFNISGNGTAAGTFSGNIVNATTHYNLNGNRVLFVSGGNSPYQNSNTFAGNGAGSANTPTNTASGNLNSFFGISAGHTNTVGAENTFVGANAGYNNLTGQGNSYFGDFAGNSNTASNNNSFFGSGAGFSSTGGGNSFFGQQSGNSNSTGISNSFFGIQAGLSTTQGGGNSFFGASTGGTNTIGSQNTLLGAQADVASNNLTNAIAIGAKAEVGQSNSLVLGSISGINGATSNTTVGIGTTSPGVALDVQNNTAPVSFRLRSTAGSSSIFLDRAAAIAANSSQIAFSSAGTADFGMGTSQGSAGNSDFSIYNYGTASNAFTIQKSTGSIGIGTVTPAARLDVNGSAFVRGSAQVTNDLSANRISMTDPTGFPGATSLCVTPTGPPYVIVLCASSLRYKSNLGRFASGLGLINRLRPITFTWKDGGMKDFGLAAEDVAKIEPLLVTYNKDGQIQGVKYDRLGVVLINAVKEQQTQIEDQRKQIAILEKQNGSQQMQIDDQQRQSDELRKQVETLRAAVCSIKANAEICKTKEK